MWSVQIIQSFLTNGFVSNQRFAKMVQIFRKKHAEGRENFHLKADSHIACRAHAVLLPCRVAKA